MIGSFSFNGIESESFGLVCKSVTRPLLPPVKTRRAEPIGLSGAYDFDDGGQEYGLRQITMQAAYIGTDYNELRSRARLIAAWLAQDTWKRLIINDEPDKYYSAKVAGGVNLAHLWQSGTIDITFDCQPFAYSAADEVVSIINGSFVNPGTRIINYKSPPGTVFIIRAATEETSEIIINDNIIMYSGAAGDLLLDCYNMEAYLNLLNVFANISGHIETFFKILPGENTVQTTGITDMTITYRPMWI